MMHDQEKAAGEYKEYFLETHENLGKARKYNRQAKWFSLIALALSLLTLILSVMPALR